MADLRAGRRPAAPGPYLLLVAAAATGACGAPHTAPSLRPEPIPYADTLPIRQPRVRHPDQAARLLRNALIHEIGHGLSVRRLMGRGHEALNVTRFDDVVSSAWFEHRNGRRAMSPEEVARGPTSVGPDTAHVLTVIAGKTRGISPGFTVRDARGDVFLLKFDPKDHLHLASAAGVITSRLFYAAGYNTPEDYILVFDSAKLALDPQAEIATEKATRKMTGDDVRAVLSLTDTLPDGRFLAIASKFVPGKPLGPFLFSSVRHDDPNDHYLHQYRRDLRGLYVISSWLNHVDIRFENTLDVFIDPPGYVRHYLIDFGASLGSGTIRPHNPREGREYNADLWPMAGRLFTLGFFKMGWEDQEFEVIHPSIGWLSVESFEPNRWRGNWPNKAFNSVSPRDGYWGAKLVGSFTDEQVRAAVEEGHLPALAADTLAKIIEFRRDKVVAYWYGVVTPIENVQATLAGDGSTLEVSFDDLGLRAGVADAAATRYAWHFEDAALRLESEGEQAASAGERQTIRVDLNGAGDDSGAAADPPEPAVLRVRAIRPGASGREARGYLQRTGSGARYEVVGLEH